MNLEVDVYDKLVITFHTVGNYDIIIIQTVNGELINLRIEEYEE
jgi:hypothetical protein|tara:strand:+ start:60860 stop:60991 length:132 start_codon:yes stop_codon:yes gene_type:complete